MSLDGNDVTAQQSSAAPIPSGIEREAKFLARGPIRRGTGNSNEDVGLWQKSVNTGKVAREYQRDQTYTFITLNTLPHLLEIVVVGMVHIAECPDFITRFQSSSIGGTVGSNCVYLRKRFFEDSGFGIRQDGMCGLLRHLHDCVFVKTGEVLVKILLDGIH